MTQKQKSWLWIFTFPFAHNNYTTFGDVLYYPRKFPPSKRVFDHEEIHARQQKEVGKWKFAFLYLFAFPFLWNPWRWKYELNAYVFGSKVSEQEAKKILRSYRYGWLLNE